MNLKYKKGTKTSSIFLLLMTMFGVFYSAQLNAQTKRIKFKGLARTAMFYDTFGGNLLEGDTTSADKSFNGYALLDLGVDIRPNKSTHIESEFRLRSSLGGFWGAGIDIEVRKLLVEGIIAKKIKYQFGDINFNLTPYTFKYNQEELISNEATIFQDFKEIAYYDNLISDTAWRQQGLSVDFGLKADKILNTLNFKAFITRTRSANIAAFPDRFFSGFQAKINQSKYLDLDFTLVDLFDLAKTSKSEKQHNNLVSTLHFDLRYPTKTLKIGLKGESGFSRAKYSNLDNINSDFFYDLQVYLKSKIGLSAEIAYKQVGASFNSAGSQSKRINWNANPSVFDEVTNDVVFRSPSLVDIYYDPLLYNQQIDQQLQTYIPKYSNALAYGPATPNRRGVAVKLSYQEPNKHIFDLGLSYRYLSEIIGSGSQNLKQFNLFNASANLHLHKFFDWDKKLVLTVGGQLETTRRQGSEVSAIQLNSNLIDLGVEYEFFKNLDILAGAKWFMAGGNEFVDIRNEFNIVDNFVPYQVDERNVLYAGGLKYRFSEDIYVSTQFVHNGVIVFNNDANSYNINRFLFLFNIKF